MTIENDLRNIVHQLMHHDAAQIVVAGIPVSISLLDEADKFTLSTVVYNGINYIPPSVRRCLSEKTHFPESDVKTFFTVNEKMFLIMINYIGTLNRLNKEKFTDLLEEFGRLAEEWRIFLDEHDQQDLIYVRK